MVPLVYTVSASMHFVLDCYKAFDGACRVQHNGSGPAPPQQQQPTNSMTDAFDELVHTRTY